MKILNDDAIDEVEQEELPDELTGPSMLEDDTSDSDEDFDDEDSDELERRKSAYSELKKADKIFNNSYTMGLTTGDEPEEIRSHGEIKLDISSPDYHLYNKEQHAEHVDNAIIQVDIDKFVSASPEIKAILGNDVKKKFNKAEINLLFDLIGAGVRSGNTASSFVTSIHVLDAISSLTRLEFKKLFDMCTYENKEILLLELDNTYHFLDKPATNHKIYE